MAQSLISSRLRRILADLVSSNLTAVNLTCIVCIFQFSGFDFIFCSFFSKMDAKFKGENMPKDANGTELNAGDNVTLIKDLKVKGAGATLKRGTMVKNIKITDDDKEIEGKIDKMGVIVLKTEFLKKA